METGIHADRDAVVCKGEGSLKEKAIDQCRANAGTKIPREQTRAHGAYDKLAKAQTPDAMTRRTGNFLPASLC